jgi:two-component system, OmpR family, response regulator VicR
MYKILLVEDELMLARIVTESLEDRGFVMLHAANAEEAKKMLAEKKPDLLVLDVMMPGQDGFSLASALRQSGVSIPIIFLTAKNQTKDVVQGFDIGGNDYLRKPFSMEELIVRIKEQLRRLPEAMPVEDVFNIGAYVFDPVRQTLVHPDSAIQLSHREAEILKRLCIHRNKVLPRRDVLLELWGDDTFFNARSMDVFITKLRRHLALDTTIQIVNIRGTGYKLLG